MASTFVATGGEVAFLAGQDGWDESPTLAYEVIEYPGGDTVDISIGGLRETRRSFTLLLDSLADYRLLATLLGQSGYLQIEGWDESVIPAMLVSCKPEPQIYSAGQVLARGSFILL